MPPVIGALAIAGIDAGLSGAGLAAIPATILGISSAEIVGSVLLLGVTIGLQFALQPDLPQQPAGHQARRQTIPPRVWACGRCRPGASYMLFEVASGVSWDVLAVCGGPIGGYVTFYLQDDVVTIDAAGDGRVLTTPGFTDGRYGNGEVRIFTRVGLATETAFANVVAALPSIWTNDHRGDTIASLAMFCGPVGQSEFGRRYPYQLPNLTAALDGPAVWDFRDLAQNPADPATWTAYAAYDAGATYALGARALYQGVVYLSAVAGNIGNLPAPTLDPATGLPLSWTPGKWVSSIGNPVLRLVDLLVSPDHGMGLDRTKLIDPVVASLIVEANLCDVLIERKDLDFEPTYVAQGFYNYDTDPAEVIGAVCAAADIWMTTDVNGTLALKVGHYRAPTITLKERHIIDMDVADGLPDDQIVNEMKLSFTSPVQVYKTVPGQTLDDDDDISLRGVTRSKTLALPWVQVHSQSRRLQKRAMARELAPLRGTMVTKLYGLAALGQRWIGLQYPERPGLEDVVVEVTRAENDWKSGRVTFDWILIDPTTIDAWDAATEEGTQPTDPDSLVPGGLPVPEDVNVDSAGILSDGTVFNVSFLDQGRPDLAYVVRYRLVDDGTGNPGPWVEQSVTETGVTAGRAQLSTFVVISQETYAFEVASKNSNGTYSDWSDVVFGGSFGSSARVTSDGSLRTTSTGDSRVTA